MPAMVRVLLLVLLSVLGARAVTGEAVRCRAAEATVSGGTRIEVKGGSTNIGYWLSIDGVVQWKTSVPSRGAYRVVLSLACASDSGGAEFVVDVGTQRANGTVPVTGSWTNYVDLDLGPVILRQAGPIDVVVRAIRKPKYAVMNLRELRLVPEN